MIKKSDPKFEKIIDLTLEVMPEFMINFFILEIDVLGANHLLLGQVYKTLLSH